jgi:hypothetical protein
MINENEILKRILLNMKYDSSMTLSENYNQVIYEQKSKNRNTKEYWDELYKNRKIDKKKYDFEIERIADEEFGKSMSNVLKSSKYRTESENDYYSQSYITYKTVIPGKTISVPDVRFKNLSKIEYRNTILQPLLWHSKEMPYSEENAKRIFSNACSKVNYFIDKNYNQCETYSILTQIISSNKTLGNSQTNNDKKYNYKKEYSPKSNSVKYYYQNNKTWVEAKDNFRVKLQYWDLNDKIFDGAQVKETKVPSDQQNCTKLDPETCIRWSWNSMNLYGGIDKGLKRFILYSDYEKAKAGEGTTYSACVGIPKDSKEKYPWFTQYVGFYDESKFIKSENPEQPWACPESAITKLPAIPSFSYGNKTYNKSISNDNEKEEYVDKITKDYMKSQEEKGYEYSWFSFDETDETEQDRIRQENKAKIQSVISGGIRIKGK